MDTVNASFGFAANQTQNYLTAFEEVSKYNVNLSYPERLWAVCLASSRSCHGLSLAILTNYSRPGTCLCRTTPSRPAS
jgi:hypothetical protein